VKRGLADSSLQKRRAVHESAVCLMTIMMMMVMMQMMITLLGLALHSFHIGETHQEQK